MRSRTTTSENARRALTPFRPVSPGEVLLEELEARGWTQADFAYITGRPVQTINEIVMGKKAIIPQTAITFSKALGTSAEYWLNLENAYRLALAKHPSSDDEITRKSKIYSLGPIKELVKRNWVQVRDPKNLDQLEVAVRNFYEIPSLDDEPEYEAAARQSASDTELNTAHRAWFFRVKHMAKQETAMPYSKKRLEKSLPSIRDLCRSEERTAKVKETLANVGIRFVIVEHLPQTKIDGGSLWLDSQTPVVALSLRYDRFDCFWFTLMHEIAHILYEDSRERAMVDDNLVGRSGEDDAQLNKIEERANQWAGDFLIPRAQLEAFIMRLGQYVSANEVYTFAVAVHVHPAIVVGQLQHRQKVPWTHFRTILVKVKPLFNIN